jgi:hypothetical protein
MTRAQYPEPGLDMNGRLRPESVRSVVPDRAPREPPAAGEH